MASWIGGTPEQRFRQYVLPAAKRMVDGGEWDACLAAYAPLIEKARAAVEAAEPGSHDHRAWTRRLASLEAELAGNVAARDSDIAVIAEGARRDAARRARRR